MTWSRRTPWPVLGTATAALVLVVVAAVLPGEGVSPFVIRIAEFLLAGGAAYLLDDAAAPLTGVTPPGVWRRRAPVVLAGAGLMTASWLGILLVLGWQDAQPPVLLATAEVVVLSLGSLAAAAVLVRRGDAEPGGRVAPVVGLLGIGALMADSLIQVALFVPWEAGEPALGVGLVWATGAVLAVAVIVAASRDPASRGRARGREPLAGEQTQ
jgi:hypothetical protein